MNLPLSRRDFLKTTQAISAVAALSGLGGMAVRAAETAANKDSAAKKKLEWTLCCGAYSFNALTFAEMLDQVKRLGLNCVEGFNWQPLDKGKPGILLNQEMSAADCDETRKRLADAGIKMDLCYIDRLEEKAAAQKTFAWAKEMGVKTLVCEPPFAAYDMVESLCNEHEINVAIHNHPSPSQYFDPATVLKVCQGRGKRIGACCDTGHWVRSGFDPVEACKKMQGRIICFHLKDVERFGDVKAECVPWGMGKGNIKGILEEMGRQGFSGIFSIEYEPYSLENFDKISQCIAYFKEVSRSLIA